MYRDTLSDNLTYKEGRLGTYSERGKMGRRVRCCAIQLYVAPSKSIKNAWF